MDPISLIVTLIVIGVLLWLMDNYIPMDPAINKLIKAVVIIAAVVFVLQAFGVLGSIHALRIN